MKIHVVVSGRNYPTSQDAPDRLELPDGSTVTDALKTVSEIAGGAPMPDSCLIAVSGTHLGTLSQHEPRPLKDGDELVIIAPVAGG